MKKSVSVSLLKLPTGWISPEMWTLLRGVLAS